MTPDYRVKKLLTEAKLDFKRLQNNVFFYCNYAKSSVYFTISALL